MHTHSSQPPVIASGPRFGLSVGSPLWIRLVSPSFSPGALEVGRIVPHPPRARNECPRNGALGTTRPTCSHTLIALLLAAGGLFSAGCGSVTNKLGEVNSSLTQINNHLGSALTNQTQAIQQQAVVIEHLKKNDVATDQAREREHAFVQRYVTGVYDLLGHVDAASTPQGEFALRGAKVFAADLARKLGTYQGPDRVDHQAIATGQITTKQVEESVRLSDKAWSDIQRELAELRREKIDLNARLEATTHAVKISQDGIRAAGGEIDALKRRITWERIWGYLQTPGGIVLCIGLIIAFPALIPLLGGLIGQIVSTFPALMSFFGVASKGTVDRVSRGVGNFKDELDKLGAGAAVTVEQVRDLLRKELKSATDANDRRVIDHVRETGNIS